jgi:hemerythrin-like domain-containing protein
MKRHSSLQPLSRQHHNGLLVALLVAQGIKKQADLRIISDFILNAWDQDLKEHFLAEEEVLLPALAGTDFNKGLISQLLNEHDTIRQLVASLIRGDADYNLLEQFHILLSNHIRFEERIFFPEAERLLSTGALQMIGSRLNGLESINCMNYPIKFWE